MSLLNDDADEFVQNVSGDEFDEIEKRMEQSYQQRLDSAHSRPDSSSQNNGGAQAAVNGSGSGSGGNRLMSAKSRPSDLRPISKHGAISTTSQAIIEEEDKHDQEHSSSQQMPLHKQPSSHSQSQHSSQQQSKVGQQAEQIYQRFSRFVIEQRVERDEFCRPIHIFLTNEELEQNFATVGFPITQEEVMVIYKDHNAHKTGYLPMEDFYKKLRCWRDYKDKREEQMNALRDQANNLIDRNRLEEIGARANGFKVDKEGGSKKRPTTAVVAGAKNLRALQNQKNPVGGRLESANKNSQYGNEITFKSMHQNSETKNWAQNPPEDKTKYYLKLAKQRKEEEERALALTIDKGKRETEFDCLHKMGEACEIAKLLNVPVSFSAFKGPDGSLKIHFFQLMSSLKRRAAPKTEMKKRIKVIMIITDINFTQLNCHDTRMKEIKREITMKEFYREYRKLKRMQNSVKNNYTQSQGAGAGGQPGKPPNISQNTIVSSYSLNRINKKERQEELKQVLHETMKLTKKLKEQLKILERNGVCGTQIHNNQVFKLSHDKVCSLFVNNKTSNAALGGTGMIGGKTQSPSGM